MNYSVFRFTLNMHSHRSQASVAAFLGDTAVRLLINITDGGNAYIINDGCTAVLSGTKADGLKLCNRCVILNNTTIQYDFTEQTTSCAGVINCELTIYGADGKIVTAPKFIIVVDERETPNLDDITSADERTALDNIFASEGARVEAEQKRDQAETARVEAETARDEAENGVVDEEGNVQTLGRVQAEAARVEEEQKRGQAEIARGDAEYVRETAEAVRQTAEIERQIAEIERQAAEAERCRVVEDMDKVFQEICAEINTIEETLEEINEGGIEE